jgi:hypothetical protein
MPRVAKVLMTALPSFTNNEHANVPRSSEDHQGSATSARALIRNSCEIIQISVFKS